MQQTRSNMTLQFVTLSYYKNCIVCKVCFIYITLMYQKYVVMSTYIGWIFSWQYTLGNKEEKTKKDENDDASLDDLLLWALYANRPRIAEMVWLRDEHQLSSFQFMISRNKVTSYLFMTHTLYMFTESRVLKVHSTMRCFEAKVLCLFCTA